MTTKFEVRFGKFVATGPEGFAKAISIADHRVSAIVTGSLIEDFMIMAFMARFRSSISEPEFESMFEGYGPLASFSGKITMGKAFGIINDVTHHDLKLIKSIRNEFAHAYHQVTFAGPPISDRCNSLKLQSENVKESLLKNATEPHHRRFVLCAMKIMIFLVFAAQRGIHEVAFLKQSKPQIDSLVLETVRNNTT